MNMELHRFAKKEALPQQTEATKLDLERYQEALVAFIGAEFDAGATREEIERFHAEQMKQGDSHDIPSRSSSLEREEMDAAASVLRVNYSKAGWKMISDWYFEDALNAHENVSETYKEDSDAA